MRTRKSNKSKRFSYSQAYELGSEESGEDLDEVEDADADVDFEEPEGGEEGQEGSAGDDDDDEVMNDVRSEEEVLLEEEQLEGVAPKGGEIDPMDTDEDDAEGDGAAVKPRWAPKGRGKWKLKLLKRGNIHAVPPYPSDLRQTRVYDGPLKPWTSAQQLLTILYGPETGHIKVIRGMLRKWFNSQTLPNVSNNEGGVMHSPWLAQDYEEKEKRWSRSWYGKYRAARPELQKSRKIRAEHVDMFKPPSHGMICFTGPFNQQQQIRTSYGSGIPVTQSGLPLNAADNTESSTHGRPKGWLLDTGGIPLGIGWAPLTGHREQLLAVCAVPYADQELMEHDAREADAEEKKRGSVQIWSIPCHRKDASLARLVSSLQFDFGRSKRMQWCPVASPDDHTMGMLAVLCGDGQVRVLEIFKANTGQENYGWCPPPPPSMSVIFLDSANCPRQNGLLVLSLLSASRTNTWSRPLVLPGSIRIGFAWAIATAPSAFGPSIPNAC